MCLLIIWSDVTARECTRRLYTSECANSRFKNKISFYSNKGIADYNQYRHSLHLRNKQYKQFLKKKTKKKKPQERERKREKEEEKSERKGKRDRKEKKKEKGKEEEKLKKKEKEKKEE